MNLITGALRKPITIIVAIIGILFFSVLAIRKMPIDIFPQLGLPTIYVAQPYGGLSPQQMEGFVTSYYEYHFLYVTGIKFVESKSIQGVTLIKLQFHPGTEMSQAIAEVVAQVNRSRAFMPPGTVPPFVVRYDAGSAPVGQLVFQSETKTLGEIQDLALFKVRPLFASLQGVSAPPPFGGSQRTVIIKVDPERMRSYGLSPDEVVQALANGNTISPSGNIRVGDQTLITPQNSVVSNIKELGNIPLKAVSGPAVYLKDIGSVENGADITSGYALVNGKRSIYIPVTKRSDASTWDVVQRIKKELPAMQAAIPEDIKVSYEFDQSGYVINSLKSLLFEGGLGAILTGLMVWLFLGDRRSAIIVIITIPIAILTGVIFLYAFGQTINIMTLGGLALSVGILVDEATVTIENIHRHLEMGKPKPRAILDACKEIALPKLLILFSILAVFVPSFFMTGVPRSMFMPLSLAVGFAMIASFLLSQTLVPVLANWMLKDELHEKKHTIKPSRFSFEKIKQRYNESLLPLFKRKTMVIILYTAVVSLLIVGSFLLIGTEIFPKVDAGQFQLRLRAPTGTRIERTEDYTLKLIERIKTLVGGENIEISSAFVGVQPPNYPINTIYLWTSGPHEAVLTVRLNSGSNISIQELKEQIRKDVAQTIPQITLSFEPGDLVDQVMNLGATTPVDIAVIGKNLSQSREYADKIKKNLQSLSYLRDVQFGIPLDYPSLQVNIDRVRAGQLGLTVNDISKSLVAATSSSRYTQPNYWLDQSSGTSYQVQVELPQYQMSTPQDIEQVPLSGKGSQTAFVRDVAEWSKASLVGEYDRLNQQRFVNITANIENKDLGSAVKDIQKQIDALGEIPAGLKIAIRGQAELLEQTLNELGTGLLLAVVVIFLLLAANFQSFKLSALILTNLPAVLSGSLLLLLLTGKTLNIQSFMGCIMAIGVSVANAILLVTNAEMIRRDTSHTGNVALEGANTRLRPILMTSLAMIAGMIPMAIGLGEGGEQTSPLGIAVIGGLLFSTLSTLFVMPLIYDALTQRKAYISRSLDPDDTESKYHGM
ncbi:efflux RND transporter permease subunit [Rhodocytophaga aerolata]|uniref:Efflux RND transporter permease subunit n=1 Tax=Rhodocytophaga aerolata TaxID=455078 RepID=A0ABT8RBX5_9BACT|nr:efflux RND transporter permease subunit [Rhodocytophaga aerolata]MDO1449612.1 efflux RND transporter permease subunit [Rhodocytophaga aerolata]